MCLVSAVADDVWQDIPLGLDPRVRDLLGNSVALNTTASVKRDEESSMSSTNHSALQHRIGIPALQF